MKTYFEFDEMVVIGWNGGATFNIYIDGNEVDCFTRYGAAKAGGPCSYEEAVAAATEKYSEIMGEIE